MKIWMDDMREAPEGYVRTYNVPQTVAEIFNIERRKDSALEDKILYGFNDRVTNEKLKYYTIEEIACDNDLGNGPAGYKLLDWFEATGRNYPIRILTSNPVARQRMRKVIERNNWEERK